MVADESRVHVPRGWLDDAVEQWLHTESDNRVLIVTGPAGTGKSRLLHAWADTIKNDDRATLAAAILRDPRGQRVDDFAWADLREALIALVAGDRATGLVPDAQVQVRVDEARDSEVVGVKINTNVLNVAMNIDLVDDFREKVAPLLRTLPPGGPIVLVIDGLDEAIQQAESFLALVSVMANAVTHAPDPTRGLGRLRLLLASQPELPLRLGHVVDERVPTELNLGNPPPSDRTSLETYVRVLLDPLPADDRDRLAPLVAERAEGVWVWAYYASINLVEDFTLTATVPTTVTTPRGLAGVYRETLERSARRVERRGLLPWTTTLELLGMVAAAQEIGSTLPTGVAAKALGVTNAQVTLLLDDVMAVVGRDRRGHLRYYHGDFGRWISAGGLSGASVHDAHDRLATVLSEMGRHNWKVAGPDAAENAMLHALATAALSVGAPDFADYVERCLGLLADPHRLNVDPRMWHVHLVQVQQLCTADTKLPGTDLELGYLWERVKTDLETAVGYRISQPLSDDQLKEFDETYGDADGVEEAAFAWLEEHTPNVREVTIAESRAQATRLLTGWIPLTTAEISHINHTLSDAERWHVAKDMAAGQELVDRLERLLELVSADNRQRLDVLIVLVNVIVTRLDGEHEQAGDLDRTIQLQAEIVELRSARNRHGSLCNLGLRLRLRHSRTSDPADLDRAIDALAQAVQLTPADHGDRTYRMRLLADTLARRLDGEHEQPGDLDRLIDLNQEIAGRADLEDRVIPTLSVGYRLRQRANRTGAAADLDRAIELFRQALALAPEDHEHRTTCVINLTNALLERNRAKREEPADLDELIRCQGELVASDQADRATSFAILGEALLRRAKRDDSAADLDQAVDALTKAVELTPDDHEHRGTRVSSLAAALLQRLVDGPAGRADLDLLIELDQVLVDDAEGEDRATMLSILGDHLVRRADTESRHIDRDQAVEAYEQAVALTPDDSEFRAGRLISLANALLHRMNHEKEHPTDLDCVIDLQREIVGIRQGRADDGPGAEQLATSLRIYGRWLLERAERSCALADFDQAIEVFERSVELTAADYEYWADRIVTLVRAHWRGYLHQAPHADLDRAVDLVDRLVDSALLKHVPVAVRRLYERRHNQA